MLLLKWSLHKSFLTRPVQGVSQVRKRTPVDHLQCDICSILGIHMLPSSNFSGWIGFILFHTVCPFDLIRNFCLRIASHSLLSAKIRAYFAYIIKSFLWMLVRTLALQQNRSAWWAPTPDRIINQEANFRDKTWLILKLKMVRFFYFIKIGSRNSQFNWLLAF